MSFLFLFVISLSSPGAEIVIEEFLVGPELSILAFSDGYTIRALPGAQDHKRIGDGDVGPNTGGMGAYAPAPVGTPEVLVEVQKALEATISGMRKDGEFQPFLRLCDRLPFLSKDTSFDGRRVDRAQADPLVFLRVRTSRLPFRWTPLHRIHAHRAGTQGPRVQRSIRRSRD